MSARQAKATSAAAVIVIWLALLGYAFVSGASFVWRLAS